jgi:hypothetical protein
MDRKYTAEQARADYLAKEKEYNEGLNPEKIDGILESIKNHIAVISSEQPIFPASNITVNHLSDTEVEYLRELGYNVKHVGNSNPHYVISW